MQRNTKLDEEFVTSYSITDYEYGQKSNNTYTGLVILALLLGIKVATSDNGIPYFFRELISDKPKS